MTPLEFKELYVRELNNLHNEIAAYADENKLWILAGEIKNTPGNLCLHLLGNVNHNIGHVIGKNDYVRNREEEFGAKNISKDVLLEKITKTIEMVQHVFDNTDDAEMQKNLPTEKFGNPSTEFMLMYYYGHFRYHLGQINYHRRLV